MTSENVWKSLLLLFYCSFVVGRCCKRKQSKKSQGTLDVVDEVNIVVVLTLLNSIFRLNTLNCQWKNRVGHLVSFNLTVKCLITVLTLDVSNLVRPPHDGLPV